jgi:hypothetical protein
MVRAMVMVATASTAVATARATVAVTSRRMACGVSCSLLLRKLGVDRHGVRGMIE